MEKKNIDWSSLGFGYVTTDYRYVSMYRDGAWDAGQLTTDSNITMNECACVLQYAQSCFEGLKAYTTADGRIDAVRPVLLRRPEGLYHRRRQNRCSTPSPASKA